jgi:hypothetical protein
MPPVRVSMNLHHRSGVSVVAKFSLLFGSSEKKARKISSAEEVARPKGFELLALRRADSRSSDIINVRSVESEEKTGILLEREREYGCHRRNKGKRSDDPAPAIPRIRGSRQ